MKNISLDSLYIKRLKVYDKNILEHLYVKKNNTFINIKTDKIARDVTEEELIKIFENNPKIKKIDINDLKLVAYRFASKANFDPKIELQRAYEGMDTTSLDYIYINPFHKSLDEYRYLITNINDIEKIRNNMEGEATLNGVIAKGSNNNLFKIKVYYNRDSVNEPIGVYFERKIKTLQLEKKKKNPFGK